MTTLNDWLPDVNPLFLPLRCAAVPEWPPFTLLDRLQPRFYGVAACILLFHYAVLNSSRAKFRPLERVVSLMF